MSAPGPGQSSVAKAGWLIALLFFGWLAFLFMPGPKKTEPPPAAPPVKPPPSRLVALGLPDNVDLEHLPEYFALYADKAEWKDDKTIFAYWNPGSNSHSYFFEAMRVNGVCHFKAISEPHDWGLFSENESADIPIRFHRSLSVITINPSLPEQFVTSCPPPLEQKKRVEIEVIKSPPGLKLSPSDVEQKK